MCHPFRGTEGLPTGWSWALPLTFIRIQSLASFVMSKWRCGSHHRELQQSIFPGDSLLAHPVLRRVVAPAQRGWVRDMNGMFFWHEWRSDNGIPTLLCWCSVITNPLPQVYRRHPLNTFKIVSIYKMVCVVSPWNCCICGIKVPIDWW